MQARKSKIGGALRRSARSRLLGASASDELLSRPRYCGRIRAVHRDQVRHRGDRPHQANCDHDGDSHHARAHLHPTLLPLIEDEFIVVEQRLKTIVLIETIIDIYRSARPHLDPMPNAPHALARAATASASSLRNRAYLTTSRVEEEDHSVQSRFILTQRRAQIVRHSGHDRSWPIDVERAVLLVELQRRAGYWSVFARRCVG